MGIYSILLRVCAKLVPNRLMANSTRSKPQYSLPQSLAMLAMLMTSSTISDIDIVVIMLTMDIPFPFSFLYGIAGPTNRCW